MMTKRTLFLASILLLLARQGIAQDDSLDIVCTVVPRQIQQGGEGVLKIKIIPRSDVRISANPEFLIRLAENENLSFVKAFFVGSELNLPTVQEKGGVFLAPDKEIEIPFVLKEGALLGSLAIGGEIVFTTLFPDNWSVKTTKKFSASFTSRRKFKSGKK